MAVSYTAMSRRRPLERQVRYTQEVQEIDEARLCRLLEEFKAGHLSTEAAVAELRSLPYKNLGFAKVDHHRALRTGFPEVVFGEGKTPEQVASLAVELLKGEDTLLVTRASLEAFDAVVAEVPDSEYDETARTIVVDRRMDIDLVDGVVVASGGTSDAPVAREAVITAELMGCRVSSLLDVGVAGLHRLLDSLDVIQDARVVVVVAGMEGALPSVVGGLVEAPVIAVPTSIGYGASFEGIAALLAMLNSCAPGVSVVNIDNGFGAGYLAAMMARGG